MTQVNIPFYPSVKHANFIAGAICKGSTHIHELWAVPIELSIAMYLLYKQLGLAFLAPCSVALVCMAGILTMAKWMGNAQKIWIRGIQTRIDVTASMLGSMKVSFLGRNCKIC